MRLTSLALWLGASALAAAQAIGADKDGVDHTVFNGKNVPPVLDLTADNFDSEIKKTKYMIVKYYR
jgi:protein disulfide-isomerase